MCFIYPVRRDNTPAPRQGPAGRGDSSDTADGARRVDASLYPAIFEIYKTLVVLNNSIRF